MSAFVHLLHLAVPNVSNNYKARLLQPLGLFTLLLAFLLTQYGVTSLSSSTGQVLGYAANISTEEVIRLSNVKRAEAGLSEVTYNSTLSQAALAKGQHMLENDYWAHVAPDGTDPWYFFSDAGYKYRYAGENLARDFSSPQAAIEAWMASPSHRDNMLSPKYTEIGIAVVEGDISGVDTTIIVQLFGTPMQVAPAVAKTEETQVALVPTVDEEVEVASTQPEVAALEENAEVVVTEPTVSPLNVSKLVASITIGLLFVLLIIDIAVLSQKRLSRSGGRVIAHISFIAMVAVMIFIAKAGEIL